MKDFLEEAGYGDYNVTPLSADAGLRRYSLLTKGDDRALFMDMGGSDYEAGFSSFLKIGTYFETIGIRVPQIYFYDLERRLSVIEHLGDDSFGDARRHNTNAYDIYNKATDVLVHIKREGNAENSLNLGNYVSYER